MICWLFGCGNSPTAIHPTASNAASCMLRLVFCSCAVAVAAADACSLLVVLQPRATRRSSRYVKVTGTNEKERAAEVEEEARDGGCAVVVVVLVVEEDEAVVGM
jgi:hypothetical protein